MQDLVRDFYRTMQVHAAFCASFFLHYSVLRLLKEDNICHILISSLAFLVAFLALGTSILSVISDALMFGVSIPTADYEPGLILAQLFLLLTELNRLT